MRKGIMVTGLIGLLAGCAAWELKYDVSRVGESIELSRPEGCETIKDIRYEHGHGTSYQVLCSDKEGNVTLYTRPTMSDSWQRITVK